MEDINSLPPLGATPFCHFEKENQFGGSSWNLRLGGADFCNPLPRRLREDFVRFGQQPQARRYSRSPTPNMCHLGEYQSGCKRDHNFASCSIHLRQHSPQVHLAKALLLLQPPSSHGFCFCISCCFCST